MRHSSDEILTVVVSGSTNLVGPTTNLSIYLFSIKLVGGKNIKTRYYSVPSCTIQVP
jgi:hypothetical protein